MQKIELFIGSPRKHGNTFSLAEMLIRKLNKDRFDVGVNFLYDFEIKPCYDCRACKKGKMTCVIPDDMMELYPRIEASDVLIFGTPIYWFGPGAKTKLLLDRFRPFYTNKKLTGKRAALLLPAGTGEGDCDLTIEMFKRSFEALGVNYKGAVTSKAYDIGEAEQDVNAVELTGQLSQRINNIEINV